MAATEQEARQVAEEAREAGWEKPSFLKELFLGTLRLDLVPDFPPAKLARTIFHLKPRAAAPSGAPAGELVPSR